MTILVLIIDVVMFLGFIAIVAAMIKSPEDRYGNANVSRVSTFPTRIAYVGLALSVVGLVGFWLKLFLIMFVVSVVAQGMVSYYLGMYRGFTKQGVVVIDFQGLIAAWIGFAISALAVSLNLASWLF